MSLLSAFDRVIHATFFCFFADAGGGVALTKDDCCAACRVVDSEAGALSSSETFDSLMEIPHDPTCLMCLKAVMTAHLSDSYNRHRGAKSDHQSHPSSLRLR